MKKIILTFTVLLISFSYSIAQQAFEDVVYLKNGSIIRGLIIEQIPNQSIKIQTADRNVFVFQMDEIEKITKELKATDTAISKAKPLKEPGLALLYSFLYAGGGQFYNLQIPKAIIMTSAYTIGLALSIFIEAEYVYQEYAPGYYEWPAPKIIGLVAAGAVWAWSMIDAPIMAKKINKKNGLVHIEFSPSFDYAQTINEIPTPIVGGKLIVRF